jgi:hypothetical protein
MVLLVGKTGAPENGDEVVKVAVDISDGDYGFRRFRWSLCWSRPRQDQKDRNTSAVEKNIHCRADHFLASYRQGAKF